MATFGVLPAYPLAETRFGKMHTLRGDTIIGRSLRLYGEFAGQEVDSILSLVRPGDHVLDLGANIGFHTLALASRVGPGGAVTSVEPQRHVFQLLCANVTVNQLTMVHCLRAAVGDAPGTCAIPLLDPLSRHNAGATAVLDGAAAGGPSDRVPLITVDSLEMTRCDFIKIDTEGFEDRVLTGARRTIETLRPTLYVEVHDQDKLRRSVAFLKGFGYSLLLHHTHFFRPDNPFDEKAQIFLPSAAGSALIALPPGRVLDHPLPGRVETIRL